MMKTLVFSIVMRFITLLKSESYGLTFSINYSFRLGCFSSSESPALRPSHFLQDRREIGGQAIQLHAPFVELSVIKE